MITISQIKINAQPNPVDRSGCARLDGMDLLDMCNKIAAIFMIHSQLPRCNRSNGRKSDAMIGIVSFGRKSTAINLMQTSNMCCVEYLVCYCTRLCDAVDCDFSAGESDEFTKIPIETTSSHETCIDDNKYVRHFYRSIV